MACVYQALALVVVHARKYEEEEEVHGYMYMYTHWCIVLCDKGEMRMQVLS